MQWECYIQDKFCEYALITYKYSLKIVQKFRNRYIPPRKILPHKHKSVELHLKYPKFLFCLEPKLTKCIQINTSPEKKTATPVKQQKLYQQMPLNVQFVTKEVGKLKEGSD